MATKVSKIELENDGKWWVVVHFENGAKWYPKITEVGKILSGLGKAEDKKYPNGKGWRYLAEFVNKCWGKTREEIDALYLNEFDPNGATKEAKALACPICGESLCVREADGKMTCERLKEEWKRMGIE